MKIVQKYDLEKIKDIVRNCGSKNVKNTYIYLNRVNYHSKDKFVCDIIDDNAFFAGIICRTHFRLLEIAVKEDCKGKGYRNRYDDNNKKNMFTKQIK